MNASLSCVPLLRPHNAQKLQISNGHLGIWWCLSLENGQNSTLSWSIGEGAEVKDITTCCEKCKCNLFLFKLSTFFDLFLGTDDKNGILWFVHYRKGIFMSSEIENLFKIHFEYAPKEYFLECWTYSHCN